MDSAKQLQTARFRECFWNERATGYEVLLQNLRNSQTSVKELVLFLRESVASEEQYVKQLGRVSAQFPKFLADSSMAPLWLGVLKELGEHDSWTHLQLVHGLQELIKQVQEYGKTLRKRKHRIKESELRTQEAVDKFRLAKAQLNKAKDQYHLVAFELDKQQQLLRLNQQQTSVNPATVTSLGNSIQKLERKKQMLLEEYRSALDRYNTARSEYVSRLEASCDVFEVQEQEHLAQMRLFLHSYMTLRQKLDATRQKDFETYNEKLASVYTAEYLMEKLVRAKLLGGERPAPAEFVEASALAGLKSIKNGNYGDSSSLDNLTRAGSRRSYASPPISFAPTQLTNSYDDLSDNSSQLFSHTLDASSSLRTPQLQTSGQTKQLSVSLPRSTANESMSMIGPGYSVIADVNGGSFNSPSLYDMNLSNVSIQNGAGNYTTSNSNSQLLGEAKRGKGLISMDFLGRKSKKEPAAGAQHVSSTPKGSGGAKLAKFATFDQESARSSSRRSKDSLSASSITDRVEATFDEPITELNQLEMEANAKKRLKRAELEAKSSERSSLGGLTRKLFSKQQQPTSGAAESSSKTAASPFNAKMAFIDSINSQVDNEDDCFPPFDDIDLSVRTKTNSDMNNLYESSGDEEAAQIALDSGAATAAANSGSDTSDSDSSSDDDSDAPMKVMLRIKPKSEMTDRDLVASPDVLRMISKTLTLNSPSDKMLSSRNRAQTSVQTPPPQDGGLARIPRPQVPPRPTNEFTASTSSASINLNMQMTSSAYNTSTTDGRTSTSPSLTSNTSRSASAVSFMHNDPLASPPSLLSTPTSPSAMRPIREDASIASLTPTSLPPSSPVAPPLPPLPAHIQEKFNEKQRLYLQRQQLLTGTSSTSSAESSPGQARSEASEAQPTTVKYRTQVSSASSRESRRSSRIELRKLNLNIATPDDSVTEL